MFGGKVKRGFSLVEVMMAAGILAIGFMLIVSLWPAGIKMTAMSTERTIGSVAANEALAKIKLYGLASGNTHPMGVCNEYTLSDATYLSIYRTYFDPAAVDLSGLDEGQRQGLYQKVRELIFMYPSVDVPGGQKYCWSALCRNAGSNKVQVTVFVSRVGDGSSVYPYLNLIRDIDTGTLTGDWTTAVLPQPELLSVGYSANYDGSVTELLIDSVADPYDFGHDYANILKYVGKGATIVSDARGRMFKVIDVDNTTGVTILKFDGDIGHNGNHFWVIPPRLSALIVDPAVVPMVGGRYPCVGVYQFTMDY